MRNALEGLAVESKQDTAITALDEIATDTDHLSNLDIALSVLRDALQGAPAGNLEALRLLLAGTLTVDPSDRVARLLGHVIIDSIPEVEIKNESGNPVSVSGPLTDTQLRATPVPISVGEVEVKNDSGNPLSVDTTDRAARALGKVTVDDGGDVTLGAKGDAEVSGAGAASAIAILKRLRTLLNGGLPAALGGNGGLVSESIATGFTTPPGGPTYSVTALGVLFSIDTSTYGRWLSLQILSNAAGNSLLWEVSNDGGTTWQGFILYSQGSGGGTGGSTSTASAAGIWTGHVPGKMVRVRCSSYLSGTTTFAVVLHPMPTQSSLFGVDTELPSAAAIADAVSNPTAPAVASYGSWWDSGSSSWTRQASAKSTSDGISGSQVGAVSTLAWANGTYDRIRTPKTPKSASASSSGNTGLWTPTTGKKFRLLRFMVLVSANAAMSVAGVLTIGLQDATTDLSVSVDLWLPAAAAGTKPSDSWNTGWIDLGNGLLSALANNVLNINLSSALTAGNIRVVAIGNEE